MGSNAKRKTTRAKLTRESKLRDKRAIKEARKIARKDGLEPLEPVDETYFGPLAEDRR